MVGIFPTIADLRFGVRSTGSEYLVEEWYP